MSRKPDSTRCVDVGFAEVDFPILPQPLLVVSFADGVQLLVSSRDEFDLAADLIDLIRQREQARRQGGMS